MQNDLILATLRIEKKLSQKELAIILNVSLSTYKLYELGATPMSIEEINYLSNYYEVSLDYLLGFSKVKRKKMIQKSINYHFLSIYICYLRKKAHISQKKLAQEFGISFITVSRYEHGSKAINLTYISQISKKFHISVDYLCGKSLKKEIL